MEKLCRICLAKNVRMYVVVNRNLHELYEKLTDIPFVTEDSRPMLACFFCCAKLKQCYRLLRKCLEAEELFAQMMNENYEPNLLLNQDHLEFCSGFVKSPIVHISIEDECQTESIAIKEELPAVCVGLDDIIEPKEEYQMLELEPENFDYSCLDLADIPLHHSESDLEDDVPLMEFKTEVEEEQEHEVSKNNRRARESTKLEPENLENSCLDVADIKPHHSESDLEDDVPLMEFKIEVEEEQEHEVSKNNRRARESTRATVTKKPKLETRRTKLEDAITAERTEKDKSDSRVMRTTQKRTSEPGTYFKEPYKSDQCSFNRVKKNIQHTRTHIGEKPFKCDICLRSFHRIGHLTEHISIHTGEKPFKCDICPRSFHRIGHLTEHIRIHTGEQPYKCDVCQLSFSQKRQFSRHILIHTDEKPYKCNVCQRSFIEKSQFSRHILIHTDEKPYKCDLCQRSFSLKGYLSQHIRIHTGKKTYKCDVCQRSFTVKVALTKHIIRTHTGEKLYKCDVCHRSFIEKDTLTKHTCIHAGEKPFKCDICLRSFRRTGHLKEHIRIHTGEKPYKCDVCQRSFSQKGNFTTHVRQHTGKKTYKCDVCQRSFTVKVALTKHIIRTHTGEKTLHV